MARLKLREVLLGRLVKPEDDHAAGADAAQYCWWIR